MTTTSQDAQVEVTTRDDGHFVRTALVIDGTHGSIDLVTHDGVRIAQVNIFFYEEDGHLIADVIDVDGRFANKRALCFDNGQRHVHDVVGNLVSADFRR